jgi:hypothetical protein
MVEGNTRADAFFGGHLDAAGDHDGDGASDILTADRYSAYGLVFLVEGQGL